MATKTWIATTNGNYGDAGNWSPSGVPVATDDVVFDKSTQNVSTGLDQTQIELGSITITANYSGDIADSTTYLQVDAARISFLGSGTVYLQLSESYATANVFVMPQVGGNYYHKGEANEINCYTGGTWILTGSITTVNSERATAGVTISNGSTATITTYNHIDGVLQAIGASSTIITYNHAGGTATLQEGTYTNLNQWGGTVQWQSDDTLDAAKIYAGLFDTRGDQRIKTITDLEVHAPATARLDSGSSNLTVTNNVRNMGGVVQVDIGSNITIVN